MTMVRLSDDDILTYRDDDNNDSTDTDESQSGNTSKESAALARGAARTAATSSSAAAGRSTAVATRGVMAGRLPASSTAASSKSIGSSAASTTTRVLGRKAQHLKVPRGGTAASRVNVKVPRGSPRSSSTPMSSPRIPKARADSIAKVSDRASKGLDVINAGLDSSSGTHSQNDNNRITKSISRVMQQAVAFGKVFIINTFLGMAVFSTYEGMIEKLTTTTSKIETTHQATNSIVLQPIHPCITEDFNVDVMDQATLPQHFLAGAMGGAAHAVLSLVFDMKLISLPGDVISSPSKGTTTFHHPILQILSSKPIHLRVPTLHFSTFSILHHSLAHSTLFGSYQLTKRLLSSQMHNTSLGHGSNDTIRVATIAVAGGVAGQFQHVISHILEARNNASTMTSSSTSLLRFVTSSSSWPTWRSTVMAFPPSAIGFLAFEYGKLLDTSNVDADR